ncbi:uncharacterized protein LOC104448227 [Eucalyptus grandis]|uniref:uncharacterized protein LOC104448227 n=1 Tax=Eucalyptus grandis TaxID=71139 RepID=UPI00192E9BC8|nr:uncharacterized protein LOC104448227 [Eucalyptus grandis]
MKASASRTPPPPPSSHRYLKPGALARLRDSRISSRSHKPDPLSRPHTTRPDPSRRARDQAAQLQISVADPAPPLLGGAGWGPRCLARKRLVAHRSGLLQSLDSGVSRGGGDPFVNVTGNDALVAH